MDQKDWEALSHEEKNHDRQKEEGWKKDRRRQKRRVHVVQVGKQDGCRKNRYDQQLVGEGRRPIHRIGNGEEKREHLPWFHGGCHFLFMCWDLQR